MPKAQPVTEYRHAGAERYEFLIDFSKYAPGTVFELREPQQRQQRRLRPHQQGDAVPRRRRCQPSPGQCEQQDAQHHADDARRERGHGPHREHGHRSAQPPAPTRRRDQHVRDQRQDLARRGGQRVPRGSHGRQTGRGAGLGDREPKSAAGSTRCTSTSSTSRSSAATDGRRTPESRAPRTWSTSARTRPSDWP